MELLYPILTLVTGFLMAAIADWIVYAALALTAASTVYSYQATQKAAKDQLKSGGVEITRQDSNAGLTIIYGERAIGGVKVWKDVSRSTFAINSGRTVFGQGDATDGVGKTFQLNAWLNRVDVLGQGPVHGITNIEIEDDSYQAPRFRKRNHAVYRGVFMDGSDTQSALTELANNSDWKASSAGTGVAYMYSRFRAGHYSSDKLDRYFSGEPMMRYHVKGRLIWDPRDVTQSSSDSSTWLWSDNPALCLLDYLTQPYGRNLDYSQIDIESFKTAADSCDVLVNVPSTNNETGSAIQVWDAELGEYVSVPVNSAIPGFRTFQSGTVQKRLTCNAALDPSSTVLENVKILLQSMRGTLPYHNGTYSLKLEDVEPTSMSFTEDDIIGGISFSNGDRSKRFNRTTVVFKNRNKKYKEDRASWPALDSTEYAALLAEDNDEELFFEVGLDAVTDYYQAEDLAEFITLSSREQLSAGMKVKSKGMLLEPGDVIEVTHETPGWSARKFRVRSVKVNVDQTADLSLTEYNVSTYTWRDTSQEPLQEDIGLASPFDDKLPVTNLAATITRTDTASGVPQGLVDLTFTAPADEAVREYVVRFKPTGTAVWIENLFPPTASEETGAVEIQFLAPQHDTVYDLEVNYFDVGGILGESAVSSFTIPEYRTDLDVDLNTIETEVGEILEREDGSGDFIPSDLSDLAVYYKDTELVAFNRYVQVSDDLTVEVAARIAGDNANINYVDGLIASVQADVDANELVAQQNLDAAVAQLDLDVAAAEQSATDVQDDLDAQVLILEQSILDAETAASTATAGVQSQVDSLQTTVTDITAATADVYLQDDAPVEGVDGVPDPIAENSRWYDSDDGNHPYVWDGTQWVSIRDGTGQANASEITRLAAIVDDPVTGTVATSDALEVLDTTVSTQGDDITTIAGRVDDLETTIEDPVTGFTAVSSAVDTLETTVSTQGGDILTNSQDITTLETTVNDPTTGVAANAGAISSLSTTVSTQGGDILTNSQDITALETTVDHPTTGVAANAGAISSLSSTVSTHGDDILTNSQDITALETTVNHPTTGVSANAGAVSSLSTTVSTQGGDILTNSQDITALETTVDNPTTGVAANASAISSLSTTVSNQGGDITAVSTRVTDIETDIYNEDTGLSATAGALDDLTTRVTSTEDVNTAQATDITTLNADLTFRNEVAEEIGGTVLDENGDIVELENDLSVVVALSSQATTALDTRVTQNEQDMEARASEITQLQSDVLDNDQGIAGNATAIDSLETLTSTQGSLITANASDITSLQSTLSTAEGNISTTATALDALTTRVTTNEGSISSQASDITTLQADIDDAETAIGLSADAIDSLDVRVTDAEGDIDAQAVRLTSLESTVDNPLTGVAANAGAVSSLSTRVSTAEGAIVVNSQDVTALNARLDTGGDIELAITANSDATSALTTRVEDTEDGLEVAATDITNLEATVNDANTGVAANASGLSSLSTTVYEADGVTTVWSTEITALETSLTGPTGSVTANSAAVSSLQSAVFEADGTTTAWTADITALQTSLEGPGGSIKANADAINTLESSVYEADGTTVAWTADITALQTSMEDPTGSVGSNSAAISTLESTVFEADGVTAAWSADITSLSNSITGTGGIDDRLGTLETADPDMVVFRQDAEPTTGLVTGALWVDTDDNNKLYVYDGTTWQAVDDSRISANSSAVSALESTVYAADGVTAAWSSDITALNTSITGAGGINDRLGDLETAPADMVVFNQAAQPTTDVVGALWIDSDDSNKLYTWDGTQWVNGTPQIDGMTVFYQSSQPTTDVVGALWFDSDDNFKTYVWDGSAWQAAQDPRIGANATAVTELLSAVYEADGVTTAWSGDITALETTVNDPTTGVSATSSAVSGLTTRVETTEDGITDLEAEYYVNLDVDGHVTGVRLYNTGVTSSFTVQADQFSVVAPGASSTAAVPFSVDTSGTITMNASVEINGNLVVDGTITQTQMGNGSVGGDQIINGSVSADELEISANAGSSGERMFFNGTDNRIEIFDASNVLRVALGDLTGV